MTASTGPVRILEGLAQNQSQIVQIQERQQEQIQTLVNTALDHESRIARQDALIERLDAITFADGLPRGARQWRPFTAMSSCGGYTYRTEDIPIHALYR